MIEKGNADWVSELPSVIKKYKNTIQSSTKMTPTQVSKKSNGKAVINNFEKNREIGKPKIRLGQLVRTADIKRDFSKGDSTHYSYKLYTITEVFHDTIPSYRITHLPERYNQKILGPAKLTHYENYQVLKELNLIQ